MFKQPRENGFTLIETLASLLVFSIVTLGIVPLIISAMHGANVARSYTVGKNAALEAMERIRGLPYHVDHTRQPAGIKVDVLDLFFPDTVAALPGQTYAAGLFTTTCDSTSTNPACLADKLPEDLPNFQLVVRACFISTGTECIDDAANRAIPVNYRWDPDPLTAQTDDPPGSAQLMELSVTTRWDMGGLPRTFDARTLLGDKQFGSFDLRGRATINNAIEVATSFQPATRKSRLTMTIGRAESDIQSTDLRTSATHSSTAAELVLLDTTDPTVEAEPIGLPVRGATVGVQAPPTATDVDGPLSNSLTHPDLGTVVGFFNGSASSGSAEIQTELPAASGDFSLTNAVPAGISGVADSSTATLLNLDTTNPLFFLGGTALTGATASDAADIASGGGVLSSASIAIPAMRLLPTTAIAGSGAFAGETAAVVVRDFEAGVECDVTADIATSDAAAFWSAQVAYWSDTTNDDVRNGSYQVLSVGSGLPDLLGAITSASDPNNPHGGSNPLVLEFEDPSTDTVSDPPVPPNPVGHEQDIYLFPVQHDHGEDENGDPILHNHPGYLDPRNGWSAQTSVSESETDEGRTVDAAVNQALRFKTVPLNGGTPDSFITISVGSMNCASDDQR